MCTADFVDWHPGGGNLNCEPLTWSRPSRICVASDLFQEHIPDEFVRAVFGVMALTRWHTYLLLTEQPGRIHRFFERLRADAASYPARAVRSVPYVCDQLNLTIMEALQRYGISGSVERYWPLSNVWIGTNVVNQDAASSLVPILLKVQISNIFVTCEPLQGPINFTCIAEPQTNGQGDSGAFVNALTGKRWLLDGCGVRLEQVDVAGLSWVVIGGENGSGDRPVQREWAQSIIDQCRAASVPVFVKASMAANRPALCVQETPPLFGVS